MKMRFAVAGSLVLPLTLVVLNCSSGLAQEKPVPDTTRTIEQEIIAHPESDIILLGKARAVLLEAIRAGDTTKAGKALQFMEHRFDSTKFVILLPREELLVAFWLNDYQRILSLVARSGFDDGADRQRLFPLPDFVLGELRDLSAAARPALSRGIKASKLPPPKTDFLNLLLDFAVGPADDTEEEQRKHQDLLNSEADEYLSLYPDSEFNSFVRNNIRFVVATSNWGFGYECSLGYLALPSPLTRYMKDYGLLSLALEGSYKEAYACLRLDIGVAQHLRQGFEYGGTWKDDLLVMHMGVLLGGGPMLSLGNGFKLTPHVGIGYLDFSPAPEEQANEGNDVSISFAAFVAGLNFDIPLNGEAGSTFLRLNFGHRSAMTGISLAKGGYTSMTLGVDFFGRSRSRDF